ncbi:fibronectin type III domain-containing protein [Vallitalea guaymasensis]|uniref:Fibronectin type-III domain-containing protein n=1 Tax=Vallitalea guaymasensis TaxID=1185412 RepID=A0A8J8MD82_9FIRM|nr:fibronectin type III domain-containing protein [Vallitalea guaymasensis]QUH30771.1 hypothetical protein HYG85_18340 [Vallitalea guaymasensis]
MKNIKKLVLFITMLIVISGVNVYAATVGNQLTKPEAGWKRIEQSDNYIVFKGDNWTLNYPAPTKSGGTTTFIKEGVSSEDILEASVSFAFKGSKLRIISDSYYQRSKEIGVKIDGQLVTTYQEYISGDSLLEQALVCEITGLEFDYHSVEIYSIDGVRYGLDSIDIDENGILLDPTLLESPSNLIASPSNEHVKLTWNATDKAESYTILKSTTSSSIDTVIASNVTDTTYIDNDVEPGVTYYYVVRAVKDGVESTDSNVASAMIEKNNNRALLLIKLLDENDKEYDLPISDVDTFMNWYFERGEGQGPAYYVFNKSFNVGPYLSRKDYITYNKIICIEVNEYEE